MKKNLITDMQYFIKEQMNNFQFGTNFVLYKL